MGRDGNARLERAVDALAEYAISPVKRIGTGLPLIDQTIGGPAPGEVGLIVGRSFTGKSIVLQNIVYNNPDIPSIFFSLEMPMEQVIMRMYSMWDNVDARKVQLAIDNKLIPDNVYGIVDAFPKHIVVDSPGISLDRMAEHLSIYAKECGERPHLVLLDYVELVGRDRTQDTGQGVENIVVALKNWAKDQKVAVWAVHQANMSTKLWEPVTEDSARYAGFAQCDFMIGVWRPHKDPQASDADRRFLEDKFALNVLKNRALFESLDRVLYKITPSLRLVEPYGTGTAHGTKPFQVSGEQSRTNITTLTGKDFSKRHYTASERTSGVDDEAASVTVW